VVLAFVASMVVVVGAVDTKPAEAAFAGKNGRIAFMSNRDGDFEIFTMRPDGSGVKQLTRNKADDGIQECSPDGKKLVFASDRDEDAEIFVMKADGSRVDRSFAP